MVKELLLYKNIFEYAKEGFFLTNNKGIIELVNPKMVELFGYDSPKELLGHPIEILVPMGKRTTHIKNRNKHIKKPSNRPMGSGMSLEGKKKNNEGFRVEVSLSHFKDEKGELKILGFVTDITIRYQAEQQIKNYNAELENKVKERTRALETALEKENELNELKTRFVSMVSHEFRTPLSSVFSSATLLTKYTTTEQQPNRDKHINRIKKSVNNLTEILNDILTLNRVEEGKMPVILEGVNIPELFTEACEELQAISSRGQRIKHIHTGGINFVTDKKLVKNIVNNLISNALKYSYKNGRVDVITVLRDDILLVKVKDYGIGIPLKEQERLFERFFRAANVTNIQGTGLGLNIVKKYTELLDGNIRFKSKPEVETEFVVELPNKEIE